MDDEIGHFDYSLRSFDGANVLDNVPGHFPLSDGIPWDDWTTTTDWNHHDEFHTQIPDDSAPSYQNPGQSIADHEGPSGIAVDDDFTNVCHWLNGAYQPPVPCSYCRHNRLQCLIIQTTPANPNPVTSCSSCVALFRECSLARGEKRQPAGFETVTPVLGHLHGVTEHGEEGTGANSSQTRGIGDETREEYAGSQKNAGFQKRQFSRMGAKILRDWFHQNQEWPYPSHEQKTELARETEFTRKQVTDWFSNARRRQKQTLQSARPPQVFRAGSPMPTDGFTSMTPMERWQQSPPEDEPVSESVIQSAIASTPIDTSQSSWNTPAERDYSFHNSADDFTSVSSKGSRNSYASSDSAVWSYHSGDSLPFPLLTTKSSSSRTRKKRAYRRSAQKDRRYQCTFCTDTFAAKYDWSRHEKSVHISLESWICTPKLAEAWQMDATCRFCGIPSPSTSHIEGHEFDICASRPQSERTFHRKDHLWQHLRKFHRCIKMPSIDVCRSESNNARSRCGFCGVILQTWSARADHLAEHFKAGSRMDQWLGDWGLESSVLAGVKDAVVPADRAGLNFSGIA